MKYKCTACGYIYDDNVETVKFEDLPADWVCPLCGLGKDFFEKINKGTHCPYTQSNTVLKKLTNNC